MNNLGEKAPAQLESASVSFFCVGAEEAGQRIDNFLLRLAKGVPKSHVYRVIRGGEVRVNRKRVDVTYRLEEGDEVRLPPMRTSSTPVRRTPAASFPIVFEDELLLVIDKPAGIAAMRRPITGCAGRGQAKLVEDQRETPGRQPAPRCRAPD